MAYVHGKNTLIYWGEYDWSDVFNQVTVGAEVETIDVTTFGHANDTGRKDWQTGTPGGTVALSGFWDGSRDLDPDFGASRSPAVPDATVKTWAESGSDTTKPLTITHNGSYGTYRTVADGSRCHIINTTTASWETSSPVNDVVSLSVECNGQSTDDAVTGGFRLAATTIECSGPLDGSGTNTPFSWSASTATMYSTGAVGTFTEVDATDDHDYGAVATIHVIDNTLDQNATVELWHATDTSGTGAAKYMDLYASDSLVAGTLDSKMVGTNPGADGTDGCWQVRVTPASSATGELRMLVAVAILPYQLFT